VSTIAERFAAVRERVDEAARRAGRHPDDVTLVAVSKTFDAEAVREAIAAGATDLGENYLQDALPKIEETDTDGPRRARWHFVGHLQRNKARDAARLFDVVETIDSVRLADALSKRAEQAERTLEVLIQVNVGGEAQKAGVDPDEAAALVTHVAELPGLRLTGLMTIHPLTEEPEDARPCFAALRELRDRVSKETGVALPQLSMGMSADYEAAIEEGATMVRIGTAIFGPRKSKT